MRHHPLIAMLWLLVCVGCQDAADPPSGGEEATSGEEGGAESTRAAERASEAEAPADEAARPDDTPTAAEPAGEAIPARAASASDAANTLEQSATVGGAQVAGIETVERKALWAVFRHEWEDTLLFERRLADGEQIEFGEPSTLVWFAPADTGILLRDIDFDELPPRFVRWRNAEVEVFGRADEPVCAGRVSGFSLAERWWSYGGKRDALAEVLTDPVFPVVTASPEAIAAVAPTKNPLSSDVGLRVTLEDSTCSNTRLWMRPRAETPPETAEFEAIVEIDEDMREDAEDWAEEALAEAAEADIERTYEGDAYTERMNAGVVTSGMYLAKGRNHGLLFWDGTVRSYPASMLWRVGDASELATWEVLERDRDLRDAPVVDVDADGELDLFYAVSNHELRVVGAERREPPWSAAELEAWIEANGEIATGAGTDAALADDTDHEAAPDDAEADHKEAPANEAAENEPTED